MDTRTIATPTHGRYLVRIPSSTGPWPLLVGFHGYGENAAIHLDALTRLASANAWLLVSVQGLHRFYNKGRDVVASWMTKEDRELAIADNIAFVTNVVAAVRAEYPTRSPLVFLGFSQGVATAFRAAAHVPADLVVAVGGDVPPDVAAGTAVPLPPVLYGRGEHDKLYPVEMYDEDIETLAGLGVAVERVPFDGGHELSPGLLEIVSRRLIALDRGSRD